MRLVFQLVRVIFVNWRVSKQGFFGKDKAPVSAPNLLSKLNLFPKKSGDDTFLYSFFIDKNFFEDVIC